MTRRQAERLVSRILEVLEQPAPDTQAAQWAQDYAAACRALAHRLEQCAAMIEAHDENQALQLAEAPPPLLDLLAVLSFRELAEWREFCQAHGYPVAPPFDHQAVHQLNEAYARGITPNHPLYRSYRDAVLRHDDEQALAVQRVIAKLNAADPKAAAELQRLENKLWTARQQQLAAALDRDDGEAVEKLIIEVESLHLAVPPSGELWQRAQARRCRLLAQRLRECRAGGRWRDALDLVAEIKSIGAAEEVTLEPAEAAAVGEVEVWATAERDTLRREQQFQRSARELDHLLQQAEEKQLAVRPTELLELSNDLEALQRKGRELEQFDQPMGDELHNRHRRMTHLLRSQLQRRTRRRRTAVIAASLLFLVLLAAGVLVYRGQRTAVDLRSELSRLMRERQVGALEKLARQLQTEPPRLANTPGLQAALRDAGAWLDRAREAFENWRRSLARIEAHASIDFRDSPPEQARAQIEAVKTALKQLAPDYLAAGQPALEKLEGRWETHLERRQREREQEFETQLQVTERLAEAELQFTRGSAAVELGLRRLQPPIEALQQLEAAPLPELRVSPGLSLRLDTLRTNWHRFHQQLTNWQALTARLQQPASLAAYLEIVRALPASEFTTQALARAARTLTGMNLNEEKFQAALFAPGPEAWEAFRQKRILSLYPTDILSPETTRVNRLRNEPYIHTIHVYRVTENALPTNDPMRVRLVYVTGPLQVNKFGRFHGPVHDPARSPARLQFTETPLDQTFSFGVEPLGRSREEQIFEAVGLKDLLDANDGLPRRSLLGILDAINVETNSSPLFRGYLAQQLHELLRVRPAEWGAPWAPAALADLQRLATLAGPSLQVGDWLVPTQTRLFAAPLDEHFARARQISYSRQARALHGLTEAAMAAGFEFAGYVDALGRTPVLTASATNARELWGWDARRSVPALLARREDGAARFAFVAGVEPLPLSPLLAFRGDRRALLARVAQSAGLTAEDRAVAPHLPPLFAAPHE